MSAGPMRPARRGFALLAVLWVLVGVAVLAALLLRTARDAIGAATNRQSAARSAWVAEGCSARARAAIAAALTSSGRDSAWHALDRVTATSPLLRGCHVAMQPAGITLDANAATGAQLRALLTAHGVRAERADSLADAIADWRDADDRPGPHGAERAWYDESHLPRPRNGPFLSERELAGVRGAAAVPDLATLMGVEPGAILITRAPLAVLASLPGFDAGVIAVVLGMRQRNEAAVSLAGIAAALPPEMRAPFQSNFQALVAGTTTAAATWIVTATARSGSPPIESSVELRLIRAGDRAAIVRRRDGSS